MLTNASDQRVLNTSIGPDKRERVRTMFASIAHRYDLANHVLSCGADFYWRKRAAEIVARVPGVLQTHLDFTIGPVEPLRDDAPKLPGAIAVPERSGAPSKRDPRPRGTLAGTAHDPKPSLAEAAQLRPPERRRDATVRDAFPAVLLPPRPVEKHEVIQPAVVRLIEGDVRFADLHSDERPVLLGTPFPSGRPARLLQVHGGIASHAGVHRST